MRTHIWLLPGSERTEGSSLPVLDELGKMGTVRPGITSCMYVFFNKPRAMRTGRPARTMRRNTTGMMRAILGYGSSVISPCGKAPISSQEVIEKPSRRNRNEGNQVRFSRYACYSLAQPRRRAKAYSRESGAARSQFGRVSNGLKTALYDMVIKQHGEKASDDYLVQQFMGGRSRTRVDGGTRACSRERQFRKDQLDCLRGIATSPYTYCKNVGTSQPYSARS
jgi:hypothetical protein